MKKLFLLSAILILIFALASCDMLGLNAGPATGTTGDGNLVTTSPNAPTIVSCVKESTEGLTDTWRITMSDGSSFTVTAENGAQGPQGDKGETGAQGPQGDKGATGAQGP